ncbi:MAG: metal ABC transporter permease, partial [Fimbriiglobus sp.]
MSDVAAIALVLAAVAAACAVPGVFLVLRRMALVGDAISHVLLLGIVLAYFVVRDVTSPWL